MLWDYTETDKESYIVLKGHTDFITKQLVLDENTIITGAKDNLIKKWSMKDAKPTC
jgi:WD40 repeat protein